MSSHIPWTAAEEDILRTVYPRLFPQEAPLVLMELLPKRSFHSCENKIHRLGIEKSKRRPWRQKQYTSEADGWYVSGLSDGEGCFRSSIRKQWNDNTSARIEFLLSLRSDDEEILKWIRRYFDCGHLTWINERKNTNGYVSNPQIQFSVTSLYDIHKCIIPHFDKYWLRAKKKRDYVIWRELAFILADNYDRVLEGHNLECAIDLDNKLKEAHLFRR